MNRLYAGTFSTVCRHKTTHIIIIFIFVILHYCNTGQYFEIFLYSLTNKTIFFSRWHFVLHVCFASFSKCLRSCIFHPSLVCVGGNARDLFKSPEGQGHEGHMGLLAMPWAQRVPELHDAVSDVEGGDILS